MLTLNEALAKYSKPCKVLLGDNYYAYYVKELKQGKDLNLTVPQLGYRALLWLQGRKVPPTWRRFPKDPLRALLIAVRNELKPKVSKPMKKKETRHVRANRTKRDQPGKESPNRPVQQGTGHVDSRTGKGGRQGSDRVSEKERLEGAGDSRSARYLERLAATRRARGGA